MFMGEHSHTIDDKGRLFIPARFRDQLGEKCVATRGLDNCLFVYPMSEWHKMTEKLSQLSFTRADSRAFTRFFFSGASECDFDKQGRILVPQTLRDYAKLEKDVVVIGVQNRVEIWSRAEWDEYAKKADVSYEQVAEKLFDM